MRVYLKYYKYENSRGIEFHSLTISQRDAEQFKDKQDYLNTKNCIEVLEI